MSWVRHEHGWMHRPWWKVAINTVLRLIACGPPAPPVVLGYGFGRIDHGGAR